MSGGTPGDDFYFLEEVPLTMFFDDGRALHGAYWHDGFGYRHSHGCVNLSITDAHWLYQWVGNEMGSMSSADKEDGPAVYVFSSGEYTNG
jgi:lipoprotein-anchoring transpeptidase ErfK/SrfK